MNNGIIYLIQPSELVGSERYKIGMSNKNNLDRCKKGYRKGSRYLCIMECNKPLILERNIKNHFNEKFKLISGNEYYEGNEKDILNTFNNLVLKYKNSNEINKKYFNESNKIKKEFENYFEDKEFGGTKKLIKINIIYNNFGEDIKINFKYIDNKRLEEYDLFFNNLDDYNFDYITKLIDKKIIQNRFIYDLNDNLFKKEINKHKIIYNIKSKKINKKILENQEYLNLKKKHNL